VRWDTSARVESLDRSLAQDAGTSPVAARVLRGRGHETAPAMRRFLEADGSLHDPWLLPDMENAVARLHHAIQEREGIAIFGDYDVDGLASTALMQRTLERLKVPVWSRIPERAQGYGLSVAAVEEAHASGAKLLLTVDNGVRAFEALERAKELGLDVIVTDHHEPDGANLPPALAIVNPKREDASYPFREISGCAVAYKFLQAYFDRYAPKYLDSFTMRYADLVALATIADCMPLRDENRILVREGLRALWGTGKAGLRALLQVANVRATNGTLGGNQIGMFVSPRLNAAGRMGEVSSALELLLCNDEAESLRLAEVLDNHNTRRKELSGTMSVQALELLDEFDVEKDAAFVLAREGWGHGMVGPLASRLVDRLGRPVVVLAIEGDMAHGSGRSARGFDLGLILEASRELITDGGGHSGACGVHLPVENIEAFRERVRECVAQQMGAECIEDEVRPECMVEPRDLSAQLVQDFGRFEPCGSGNHEPELGMCGATIIDGRNIGAGGAHLKWRVKAGAQEFDALWWSPGDKADGFGLGARVDLNFTPQLNTFNGRTTLQMVIKDARLSES
jgi:single-stranded-DNA-specific exonuclease